MSFSCYGKHPEGYSTKCSVCYCDAKCREKSQKKEAYLLLIVPSGGDTRIAHIERKADLDYQREIILDNCPYQVFAQRYQYDEFEELLEEKERVYGLVSKGAENYSGAWLFTPNGKSLCVSDFFQPGDMEVPLVLGIGVLSELIPAFSKGIQDV